MIEESSPWGTRTRLRWNRAAAVAVATAMVTLTSAGSLSSVAAVAPSAPGCDTAPTSSASARVTPGARPGKDPNSVTPARAAAMDRVLKRSVARLGKQGTLDRSTGGSTARSTVIQIRTHVHVITKTDGTGAVPMSRIKAQIDVLNKAYAGGTSYASAATPFRFVLATVDVTKNNNWYNWDPSQDNDPAKKALHRGGYAELNLYIAKLADGLLGYATFPDAGDLKDDGVVVYNQSLPGGSAATFNEGDTGTHEIGHWLGLFHTFQNGCAPPGDYVSDTPYQADGENIFFCRGSDDTCKQPGKDPVHNFMSYGNDVCMNRFTAGQSTRMSQSWYSFRNGR